MSKYSSELKLEIVKYHLENHMSIGATAKHFNVPHACVERWIKKYSIHGATGLIKNLISSYDGDFKLRVVEYMHNNHLSANETAMRFNLATDHIVSGWERIYYEEGPQALYRERRGRNKKMSSKPERKKLSKENEKDLIAEIQQLRMENAYLKKLNALVQERIKRENPKK